MQKSIVTLVNDIRSNSACKFFDEAATKQGIILRVLELLGWNLFDIGEVTPEYTIGGGRVDYSLQCYQGTPKVFIEVKKVSEDLERHQDQLLGYSFKVGVRLAVLTNGISWWFYLPLNEGSWEQRKFYAVHFQQDVEDIASKLEMFLSKENVLSGTAVENAQNILNDNQKKDIIQKALPKALNKVIFEPNDLFVELVIEAAEEACGYRPDFITVEKYILNYFKNNRAEESSKVQDIELVKPKQSGKLVHATGKQKIGQFVQQELYQILQNSLLPNNIILQLEDSNYSKKELNLNYPLLKRIVPEINLAEQRKIGKYSRYYKNPVDINGVSYLVSSQWYDWNASPLELWLLKHGLDDWSAKLDY